MEVRRIIVSIDPTEPASDGRLVPSDVALAAREVARCGSAPLVLPSAELPLAFRVAIAIKSLSATADDLRFSTLLNVRLTTVLPDMALVAVPLLHVRFMSVAGAGGVVTAGAGFGCSAGDSLWCLRRLRRRRRRCS